MGSVLLTITLVKNRDLAGLRRMMDVPVEQVFENAGFAVEEIFPFKHDRAHYLLKKTGKCVVKPLFKTWLPATLIKSLEKNIFIT